MISNKPNSHLNSHVHLQCTSTNFYIGTANIFYMVFMMCFWMLIYHHQVIC